MSAFPNWEKYAVVQQREQSGCIPTGYEILLRAANVTDIDYSTFQDDFDLDKERSPEDQPLNNFESVANVISHKYPHVQFTHISFPRGHGEDKLRFIEDRIVAQQPVLISLSLAPFGHHGWHIMPVVDATEDALVLLEHMGTDGVKHQIRLKKADLIKIHNEFEGGDDVAYLVTTQSDVLPES